MNSSGARVVLRTGAKPGISDGFVIFKGMGRRDDAIFGPVNDKCGSSDFSQVLAKYLGILLRFVFDNYALLMIQKHLVQSFQVVGFLHATTLRYGPVVQVREH